ncbi:hypothetical protein C8J56DRAFT_1052064 [Mycena floridula]|nr:hypothetical protein C8J56DRAFT_1052064 [Mycena floridula]
MSLYTAVTTQVEIVHPEVFDFDDLPGFIPIGNILPYPLGNLASTAYNKKHEVPFDPIYALKSDHPQEWRKTSWLESRITWLPFVGLDRAKVVTLNISMIAEFNIYTQDLYQKWINDKEIKIGDVFPEEVEVVVQDEQWATKEVIEGMNGQMNLNH